MPVMAATAADYSWAAEDSVGFELREDTQLQQKPAVAAFALAELLTGVRVTIGQLEESNYQCGIARVP
jgi:hypothetical protein